MCFYIPFQYKSPSLSYTDYPQYGTLNWGLSPTIIYKTPEPDTSLKDVGNDYMKCSISAGNVELLTPPLPNYKKLLRRSRRRMERRYIKKRRIYFGSKFIPFLLLMNVNKWMRIHIVRKIMTHQLVYIIDNQRSGLETPALRTL